MTPVAHPGRLLKRELAARKLSAVRWNVASNIVVAWVVTLPAAAVIGALFYALTRAF